MGSAQWGVDLVGNARRQLPHQRQFLTQGQLLLGALQFGKSGLQLFVAFAQRAFLALQVRDVLEAKQDGLLALENNEIRVDDGVDDAALRVAHVQLEARQHTLVDV